MKNEEVPMKNRCMFRATAVMSFLILCLCTTSAFAENRAEAFNVTPFVGGFNFDMHLPYDAQNWTYGLGLGYNFSEKLGAEFTINAVQTKDRGSLDLNHGTYTGDYDAKVYLYKLDLLYHLTNLIPGDMIVPYLAAGIGDITYSTDRPGVNTDNNFAVDYGGGLKIFLTKDLALRGDMRHVIDFNSYKDHNNFLYTVGLTYEIGGKTKEIKPEPIAASEPASAPAPVVVTPPSPPSAPAPKVLGSIIFRNILFDFDKSNIKPESYQILDEVTEYLKANADIKMEVQGHTDSVGTAEYNLKLSDRRAASVKKYLVDKGVEADRLKTKGYGLTKPVVSNDTEENRAMNRRVEFKPIQ